MASEFFLLMTFFSTSVIWVTRVILSQSQNKFSILTYCPNPDIFSDPYHFVCILTFYWRVSFFLCSNISILWTEGIYKFFDVLHKQDCHFKSFSPSKHIFRNNNEYFTQGENILCNSFNMNQPTRAWRLRCFPVKQHGGCISVFSGVLSQKLYTTRYYTQYR